MPSRITELSETQIVDDLMKDLRRQMRATAASQEPIWTYNTYTISGSGDTAHTLTYIPYGINVVLLNGLGLTEGTDYTADYTTGIVTVSATLAAGDVLHVRYVTNGDLVAFSGPVFNGAIVDTFNRANTTTGMGTTSDGQATWSNLIGTTNVQSNQATPTALAGVNLWAVAVLDGTSANGTLQVTLVGGMTSALVFRCVDASNFWRFQQGNSANSQLYKIVAGVETLVASVTSAGNTAGDVYKVVTSGSSITCYHNGTSVMTATDSALSTATLVGLLGSIQNVATWDDFSYLPQ